MRGTAMGKEAEIKTDSRTDLAVGHDDSVVFSAWPRRQSRAGFAPPDSELGGRRGSSVFGIRRDHFAPGGKKLVDRSKLLSHGHLRRVVDPGLGGGVLSRLRRGDSGPESGRRTEGEKPRSEGRRKTESGDPKRPYGTRPRPSDCVPEVLVA